MTRERLAVILNSNGYGMMEVCLIVAEDILAEIAEEKPTAPASLVEELRTWQKKHRDSLVRTNKQDEELDKILSRYEAEQELVEESLVELADKKGIINISIDSSESEYMIELNDIYSKAEGGYISKCLFADTYPEAEQAARQYLMALPDREAKEAK